MCAFKGAPAAEDTVAGVVHVAVVDAEEAAALARVPEEAAEPEDTPTLVTDLPEVTHPKAARTGGGRVVWLGVAALLLTVLTTSLAARSCATKPEVTKAAAVAPDAAPARSYDASTAPRVKGTEIVVLKTNRGEIKLRLLPAQAANSSAAFLQLLKEDYYKGRTFKDSGTGILMTSATAALGDGAVVERDADFHLLGAERTGKPNTDGAVGLALAATGDGVVTPELYFCIGDIRALDNTGSTVFAQVITGKDILHKLKTGDVIQSSRIEYPKPPAPKQPAPKPVTKTTTRKRSTSSSHRRSSSSGSSSGGSSSGGLAPPVAK
jgi:cyclophilin family peptidyl-prolyl cis-trans isomerase